jgi:hypothetical protein
MPIAVSTVLQAWLSSTVGKLCRHRVPQRCHSDWQVNKCDIRRKQDHLRQHTPNFDRFHSSLGLLPPSRVVRSFYCGSAEHWYDSTMAVNHRDRCCAESIWCRHRRLGGAVSGCRGFTVAMGGVVTGDPRCRRKCRPSANCGWLPTREPSRPSLFIGRFTD